MPSPDARQLEIVITSGGRHYARCLLEPREYFIGHDRKNEITVDEPSISARHARLVVVSPGEIYLQDNGSANGTYVDGELAQERMAIVPGSRIEVGACTMELREKLAFA